ncbi:MAG: aminotransferase class V-fold PLP-dependent enzyme [Pirellulales bacterium]
MPRIYFDNAATSWPKPEAVYRVVDECQRTIGAAAGRGGYRSALEAGRSVERARQKLANLLHAGDTKQIVFASNGTDALNLAIHGLLRPGDHVVTTVCEHNSVLRPLRHAIDTLGCEVDYVSCDSQGVVAAATVQAVLRSNTRLVAIVHASNVTGAIQPIAEVARFVQPHPALLLVDAAQSVGRVPIDLRAMPIDLLAAPGHKGLLGPLGTGFLFVRAGVESQLSPLRQGGTGSRSNEDSQPLLMPDKFESGNLNVPALAGLAAGIDFVQQHGVDSIRHQEEQLTKALIEGLQDLPGVTVYCPTNSHDRVAVVSIAITGYDPHELAAVLDSLHGIECRAGLHCAPRMHQALGTEKLGGTVRFSLGCFTTTEEVETVVEAVGQIAKAS